MLVKTRFCTLILAFTATLAFKNTCNAQVSSLDSLSIIELLDSLFALGELEEKSLITFQLGCANNTIFEKTKPGTRQTGFSPGVSYYHKSGFYTDISAYWNNDFSPQYNFTTFTFGYLDNISKNLSYSFTYDHSVFSRKGLNINSPPLTNSLNPSLYFNIGNFELMTDYSLLFGNGTTHRFQFNPNGRIDIKGPGFIKKITLLPCAGLLFGDDIIYSIRVHKSNKRKGKRKGKKPKKKISFEENNAFGLMRYGFGMPISLEIPPFSLLISYRYNIPRQLKDDIAVADPFGYLSLTLDYSLTILHKNKKSQGLSKKPWD